MGDYKIGQTIRFGDDRQGIIRWLGRGTFSTGDWVGVELQDDSGKNDGSVKNVRYFECAPGHGMMIRPNAIHEILEQPAPPIKPKPTNGATARPRPSSGLTADVARKRQSLMGAGSTTGSRLSVRSPTKSPTKARTSSASSNASTPRTGTPATTARTSDSSAKSRLSTSIRPSIGPLTTTKPVSQVSRSSIGGRVERAPTATKSQRLTSTAGARAPLRPATGTSVGARVGTSRPATKENLSLHAEQEEDAILRDEELGHHGEIEISEPEQDSQGAVKTVLSSGRTISTNKAAFSRPATVSSSLESKAASLKEIEQLKAKIRTREQKLTAQEEKVKAVDNLQADKEKLENVLQALQNKLRTTLQTKAELQARCEEAEARALEMSTRDGEHESELEMATLDKEMAEERAEILSVDLETLRAKYEELELELEILREENKEFGAVMSPEDKASTGWIQMQRERDRLKDALGILRDVLQEKESDLGSQIKELQHDLTESESVAVKYHEVAEKLARSESVNKHLMEQLEAVESNEDLNMALEAEREQKQNLIDQLREQLQTLQEEAQVSDELELYHVATEKELQQELDEHSATLNEKEHAINEQSKIIEDLEYTLSKFRDVVQGLQSDIDDLRRSRDITESEAHEMSSKSRAMMELNMQLQNSAAKMQLKTIDIELGRMQAEESAEHLDIVQGFVPDSYETEKPPILALLCMRRIKSKANLITTLLRDRIKDRPHLVQDDPFSVFDTIERLYWISSCCDRFLQYLSFCRPEDLTIFRDALHELEPVERTLDIWIESLKRDELSREGAEMLQRMRGILSDMTEKCIPESIETAASELSTHMSMIEKYCDSATSELNMIAKLVQSKLGQPAPEDGEAIHFDKKMDQLATKTRTIRYIAGKAFQSLEELRLGSMCITEPTWVLFSDAEETAQSLSRLLRDVGNSLLKLFAAEDDSSSWSYLTVVSRMQADIAAVSQSSPDQEGHSEAAFSLLATRLQSLHATVEDLAAKASQIGSAVEFERRPSPWVVRSKELKEQEIVSQKVQEQLRELKSQAENQAITLSEKDKQLEEQQIKIDLLESRTKETKQASDGILKLKTEAEALRIAKEAAERELQQKIQDMQAVTRQHENEFAELEMLRTANATGGSANLSSNAGKQDDSQILQLQNQINFLNAEILNLQAAVRYLKMENNKLKVPSAMASARVASHAWLDATMVSCWKPAADTLRVKAESEDVFKHLLNLAKESKPLALKPLNVNEKTSWRPTKDTPRYKALRQREELERWEGWKDDLVRRARVLDHGYGHGQRASSQPILVPMKTHIEPHTDKIHIVGSPPR